MLFVIYILTICACSLFQSPSPLRSATKMGLVSVCHLENILTLHIVENGGMIASVRCEDAHATHVFCDGSDDPWFRRYGATVTKAYDQVGTDLHHLIASTRDPWWYVCIGSTSSHVEDEVVRFFTGPGYPRSSASNSAFQSRHI